MSTISSEFKCTRIAFWEAYYCEYDYLDVLMFESLDSDSMDRALQPITIKGYNKQGDNSWTPNSFSNTLNAFMDHIWDGFYTGQRRVARFPSIVGVEPFEATTLMYEIEMTSSAPRRMRY